MSPVVLLVHGSMHGGWCWAPVCERLAEHDVRALAFDLPGHGARANEAAGVGVADYVEEIRRQARSVDTPVVLVGHSMAGHAISKAAESLGDRVAHLVYLSAQGLADGQSWADSLGPERTARYTELARHSENDTFRLSDEDIVNRWLSTLEPNHPSVRWVLDHVTPQPFRPLVQRAELAAFHRMPIPKTYLWPRADIHNNAERVRASLANLGPNVRYREIDGDHDCMVSAPDAVTDALLNVLATATRR